MSETIWRFKAIKPIRAEHPVGSGIIVEYQPGEDVPAGEWGQAASWLVERDKIMRYGLNQYEDGHSDFPPTSSAASEGEPEGVASSSDAEFPKHKGGPWYELSNGEQVRGKDQANAAEAALGETK